VSNCLALGFAAALDVALDDDISLPRVAISRGWAGIME
jgi:hypothetical protein